MICLTVFRHGDDFVFSGRQQEFEEQLSKHPSHCRTSCTALGDVTEVRILDRIEMGQTSIRIGT